MISLTPLFRIKGGSAKKRLKIGLTTLRISLVRVPKYRITAPFLVFRCQTLFQLKLLLFSSPSLSQQPRTSNPLKLLVPTTYQLLSGKMKISTNYSSISVTILCPLSNPLKFGINLKSFLCLRKEIYPLLPTIGVYP